MAGPNGKVRSHFGEKLRAEIDRQRISIRELSRRIDPGRPEIARRNLSRWISGTRPTKPSRVLVAHALGVEPGYFDEDDEDEDPEVEFLVSSLIQRVHRLVDEQVDARLASLGVSWDDGKVRS